MIDFGLKPCPLCGGEPTVEHLAQNPEQLRAVIKCSRCGLTLDWETEINVGISRSGKRTPVKAGLDPIEAWNRRHMCDNCGERVYSEQVGKLPNCNDCGALGACEHEPKPGQMARINCPLWRPMEAK
jgi:transcription elongation factor Elf1